MVWLLYLLVGACAGVLAGLFGVGGGAIIVPILIVIFTLQNFDQQSLVHLALGTSFATIVFTSISSIIAHHRLGNIHWSVARGMTPGLIVGVILGSMLATNVSGAALQLVIAVFLILVALQMYTGIQPSGRFGLPATAGLVGAGSLIGGASAFFGIGGGSLTVPFLSTCRMAMINAVATSAACGLPIALFGALAYGWRGMSNPDLPLLSSGYIFWPAFIGIALASVPCARLGARLATRLPEQVLKKSFAVLLLLIASQLLLNR